MDQARPLLYVSFGFVLLLLWQDWIAFTNPPAFAPVPEAPRQPQFSDMPEAGVPALPQSQGTTHDTSVQTNDQSVEIRTDVLSMTVSARGGNIIRTDLSTIPVHLDDPTPYRLFRSDNDARYVMQSGLLHDRLPGMAGGQTEYAPSHHTVYTSAATFYQLANGQDTLRIPFIWRGRDTEVEKVLVLRRGSYVIDVEHWVRNKGKRPWVGRQYTQLRRSDAGRSNENRFLYTFTGAAYYDGAYTKQDFAEIAENPLDKTIRGGWAAMLEHYFVSAIIPEQTQHHDYYSKEVSGSVGSEYLIGVRSPPITVPPGREDRFHTQLYVGPKLQKDLEQVAPSLELTVDYGIFTVISKPLFWLLEYIYRFLGNWGWSIIALTLLIKLVFYKLSEVSYRSMARMRKFQPEVMRLRERYKHDRQQMNQAMMGLYREEKVNPLGGCFPILVQIPVFIALYWVLLESVELRQAPFVLWIQDLSVKDPYFVLPVLMGISMFVQNRLNPTPPDPIQAKVMMLLPFVFTIFFAFFPAGLVLYWVANNALSIAQQWVITRRIENTAR